MTKKCWVARKLGGFLPAPSDRTYAPRSFAIQIKATPIPREIRPAMRRASGVAALGWLASTQLLPYLITLASSPG